LSEFGKCSASYDFRHYLCRTCVSAAGVGRPKRRRQTIPYATR
jgi:hypothetical protein